METGLKYLWKQGRRKIGYVCSKEQFRHYSAKIRLATFQRHAGAEACPLILESNIDSEKGRKEIVGQMQSFLTQNLKIDAIILYADIYAPLLYHAAYCMNLRIPQDLAVIAYNDTAISKFLQPEITALTVDYHKLAENSLSMLMKIIKGEAPDGPLAVKYVIIRRGSAE